MAIDSTIYGVELRIPVKLVDDALILLARDRTETNEYNTKNITRTIATKLEIPNRKLTFAARFSNLASRLFSVNSFLLPENLSSATHNGYNL
jgi:hypothetical protein